MGGFPDKNTLGFHSIDLLIVLFLRVPSSTGGAVCLVGTARRRGMALLCGLSVSIIDGGFS